MDDDVFKREVLSRLDKIVGLLSVSCALSSGSLDRPKAEAAMRHILRDTKGETQSETPQSEQYRINDEMQDDYLQAMQRWKEQKSL
jgi:hypothetical protein